MFWRKYKISFGWIERWLVCQPCGDFGVFYAGNKFGLGFIWKRVYRSDTKWVLRIFLLHWDFVIIFRKRSKNE